MYIDTMYNDEANTVHRGTKNVRWWKGKYVNTARGNKNKAAMYMFILDGMHLL